jgi:hypothetical protein
VRHDLKGLIVEGVKKVLESCLFGFVALEVCDISNRNLSQKLISSGFWFGVRLHTPKSSEDLRTHVPSSSTLVTQSYLNVFDESEHGFPGGSRNLSMSE